MIFGPSLIKEVDPSAISKMGPTFPKVAEGGPKCKKPRVAEFGPKGPKCGTNIRIECFYADWGEGLAAKAPGRRG